MIASPVRCILFDAVGTLIYPEPPVHLVYTAAAGECGLTLHEALVERRFVDAFRKQYTHAAVDDDCTTSEEIERNRWRAIVIDVFQQLAPCDALFERLWHHFAQPASWRLFDDVTECLRGLSDRGFLLGIASNFDRRLHNICRGLPPLDACDHCFVSSQVGVRKPARAFFRAIERATSLEPQQLMLIGDDWDADYLAATAAGWHAVHLNRAANVATASSLRSLAELS